MKILVLSDMGQQTYHVGDEAMGIAAADEMISRGHEVVFLTRSTEHSQRFVGAGDYHPTLPFPWPPADRERYLADLIRFVEGERDFTFPETEADYTRFVEGVAEADAVLLAGGGNMNSRYGWLLYERVALLSVAHHLGKPVVVSGQSLGPVLSGHDAGVLASALSQVDVVSMREVTSFTWCRTRGIAALAGLDDATFYEPGERRLPGEGELYLPEDYLSVTFNHLSDEQVEAAAQLLDRASEELGLAPVFVPHMGDPALGNGDVVLHQRIAERMKARSTVLPMVHADTAVRVHRGAALVLTTRYHPAVLALAYGVPALGLLPDAFTDIRLGGALSHYGLEDFALALDLLDSPHAVFDALAELHSRRAELSAALTSRGEQLRLFQKKWWDAVAATLTGAEADLPILQPAAPLSSSSQDASGTWRQFNELLRPVARRLSFEAQTAEAEFDRAQSYNRR
ncbi:MULTISPECIES: polysaccharide pyruvyl transferase family protein [unclassified Rothia (in: high G+C Gram-positive bacteria)]|uniref:polysaccharide pyruvyl transferase family protein n=1 Tax=unclassified Rothia (in: high G+C Gram-positive bacteria) TaxID=2689056 RepID=UPI00195DF1DD|nr:MULTISPECIES: polysaccharide pyruvyl transferase family protein [unclassified Rothia (in: high G+C Gram-positive bacteria)]MBM7052109.1 polysaccharide pyruvyl transferase family protein [Rothia sp. ZJ1223]QRZ61457.1 polysaccharide pyruvyl transferase family protein [Rothia sp. ZJ932]